MINRKIRCKMSWSDFQKQKLLDSFVNKWVNTQKKELLKFCRMIVKEYTTNTSG
jgi:hypothetical protein